MDHCYTFHKTVLGYSHSIRDIPCEDASASHSDGDRRFHIAAVADGHGDATCMRSETGALAAVQTAVECLTEFAEQVLDAPQAEGYPGLRERLSIPKHRAAVMRQLTDVIVSRWYSFVERDATEHPFSEEELKLAGPGPHAYGATLIAALMLPEFLILIQQGDGRCDVFFEDGRVEQPIPWDDRCYENVTTSLCDEDAAEGIRFCVLDRRQRQVAACYLGSDGVEDSYRDMDGTHRFYMELSCRIHEDGPEIFEASLADRLSALSRKGSGDDISVSGIVDLDCIPAQIPAYRRQIIRHSLQEQLTDCKNRKAAMERKYGVLGRRVKEAEDELKAAQTRLKMAQDERERLEAECRKAELHTKAAMERWQECIQQKKFLKDADVSKVTGEGEFQRVLDLGMSILPADWAAEGRRAKLWDAEKKHKKKCDNWRKEYNRCLDEQMRLELRLTRQKNSVAALEQEQGAVRQRYEQAQEEFSTYQNEYQEAVAECDRVQNELNDFDSLDGSDFLQVMDQPGTEPVLSEQSVPLPQQEIPDEPESSKHSEGKPPDNISSLGLDGTDIADTSSTI